MWRSKKSCTSELFTHTFLSIGITKMSMLKYLKPFFKCHPFQPFAPPALLVAPKVHLPLPPAALSNQCRRYTRGWMAMMWGESRWILTTQLPTCTVPSLSSSFILGASSPLRTAVKSLREKSWRSSVRWPGSVSNRSSTLSMKKNCNCKDTGLWANEWFWMSWRAKDTRRDLTL